MGAVKTIEHESNAPAVITPADMIQQAIAKGSGVEVMERLLALQERHDAFHARKAYDSAIADLRANLPDIIKSQEGYGYKYEDLADIVRQVSPVMSERGLSFTWDTDTQNGEVIVTCILTHRDGHSNKTRLSARPDTSGSKNAIQAIGSAVTYLQRYTLKAALGIAASKDDDGAAAGQRKDAAPAPEPVRGISKDTQARALFTMHERELRLCTDKDQLREAWKAACADKDSIPVDWQRDLRAIMDEMLAGFNAVEKQRPDDDGFPGDLSSHFDRMIPDHENA